MHHRQRGKRHKSNRKDFIPHKVAPNFLVGKKSTNFFVVPFFMLSGFAFPIANMPTIVQWLTYLNPLRYFLVIIRGVFLKGVGISVLWPQYVAMTIIGLVVFTTAVLRFRKRLD